MKEMMLRQRAGLNLSQSDPNLWKEFMRWITRQIKLCMRKLGWTRIVRESGQVLS